MLNNDGQLVGDIYQIIVAIIILIVGAWLILTLIANLPPIK
jgi:hypothetical protein